MGRHVINQIECAKCHKMFDVATEDIEWERYRLRLCGADMKQDVVLPSHE